MKTVAIIGPDGAGKTTVARRLEEVLPMRATYLYMGVNFGSSNRVLPTSWLIRKIRDRQRQPGRVAPRGPSPPPRARSKSRIRGALRLMNRVAEESYRQVLTWWYTRRGSIVLFDRHFFADFYTTDIGGDAGGNELDWTRRLHGAFLGRLYPKPDLVVYLDAPAELLYARKGEGTVESLDRQRRGYERLRNSGLCFVSVDASRPLDAVVDDVAGIICHYHKFGTLAGAADTVPAVDRSAC